ncbi:MAG: Trp operon repressor [uncultured bacterium]|nr:MAG: Trp operon repressor [uncultured bacterium]
MSESPYLDELITLILQLKDKKAAKDVLSNLLTPQELEEIARRVQIFKLLKKGIPQRLIAEQLNVSIGTISRGSRELQYGKPGINRLLS